MILIAPGIDPQAVVTITEGSLTSDRYSAQNKDPHVDPIQPQISSPLFVIDFAYDLMKTSAEARGADSQNPIRYFIPFLGTQYFDPSKGWQIPNHIAGLVLLSGPDDKYVFSPETEKVLSVGAPQFQRITYPLALHEIDNEKEEIRSKAYQDIQEFLRRTE